MGYQETILEMDNHSIKQQVQAYHTYRENRKDYPMLDLIALVEVSESFQRDVFNIGLYTFKKGQHYLYIGGERSHQRIKEDIEEDMHIKGVKNIISMDDILDSFESHFSCLEKYELTLPPSMMKGECYNDK